MEDRIINLVVNIIVLVLIIVMLIFGCFAEAACIGMSSGIDKGVISRGFGR